MKANPNQLTLLAQIAEIDALRYTPAGVPAINFRLLHESQLLEAGQSRKVAVNLKALALGSVAERLAQQQIGSSWFFQGFLASLRNAKSVVFHILEFVSI